MKRFLITALLTLYTTFTYAIVDISEAHTKKEQKGPSGYVSFSFKKSSGNSNEEKLYVDGKYKYTKDDTTRFAIFKYGYGESTDNKYQDKSFFHYRHIEQKNKFYALEVFGQRETDDFKGLRKRVILGAGTRLTISNKRKYVNYVGLGLFTSNDKYSNGAKDRKLYINNYYLFKYNLSDKVTIGNVLYYQPMFYDTSKYRLLNNLSVSFRVDENIGVVLSHEYSEESDPYTGVQPSDSIFRTNIRYTF